MASAQHLNDYIEHPLTSFTCSTKHLILILTFQETLKIYVIESNFTLVFKTENTKS